jgi:hypothetical protein
MQAVAAEDNGVVVLKLLVVQEVAVQVVLLHQEQVRVRLQT